MKVQVHQKSSLVYAQIDNMYSAEEIAIIKKELIFLESIKESLRNVPPATKNGQYLKSGSGFFIDDIYADRKCSTILQYNRRIFSEDVINELSQHSCFFNHIRNSTEDSTLVNFYGEQDLYEAHCDASIFTVLTFFSLGKFEGGYLSFTDYDVSISPDEGRTIIFPGCVFHKAEKVLAETGNYRVTIAQFMQYR